MNNLYKQKILELYQDQTDRGTLENPSFLQSYTNPLCGDSISITCSCDGDYIKKIRFIANGCVLSQAAAAFIATYSQKKSIKELYFIDENFMQQQLSLALGPTRLRCIMLPVECLFQGFEKLQKDTHAAVRKNC